MFELALSILSIIGGDDPPEHAANNQFMRMAALTPGIRSVVVRDGGGYDVTFSPGEWSADREKIVRDLAAAFRLAPLFFGEDDEQEDDDPC